MLNASFPTKQFFYHLLPPPPEKHGQQGVLSEIDSNINCANEEFVDE